jgi:hypothetical protein
MSASTVTIGYGGDVRSGGLSFAAGNGVADNLFSFGSGNIW